ncbi:hypothetical protein [Prochlorococcus marinus]|uniref:hypothetical protein n=1 Tax=Prochlorococcus marinus TaxID=1219 RepID=UPI00214B1AE8|nr:hypothetical protein [Prochlorococcus marinus]
MKHRSVSGSFTKTDKNLIKKLEGKMENEKRIEKLAAVALNVTKVLVIIYLGIEEVIKISKSLIKKLDAYFDDLRGSREWASQAYAILKKRHSF